MRIQWTIKKKRGNFRPTLNYELTLEEHEKAMAVHAVGIDSLIPYIPRPHESHCLPGENERVDGWEPRDFVRLSVPHFKTGEIREFIRLPYRENMDYPEVEASFRMLRERFEAMVRRVYGQSPFEETGSLDVTPETAKDIAAAVTARKLLGFSTGSRAA